MAYRSVNPYTNEVMREFDNATEAQIADALNKVDRLYHSWQHTSISERAVLLHQIADQFKKQKADMAKIMTLEMGKLLSEAEGEVDLCIDIANWFADHAEELLKPQTLDYRFGQAYYLRQATGPIIACEPWNFPLYQVMRVFAPNFMLGNPIILKHASNNPQSALLIEKIIQTAGAPEGSLINLFVDYDQVGEIIADRRIAGVALTGSERGGRAVAKEAGENLKKSTLELGGSDAFIVLADADKKAVLEQAPQARLYNCGQVCTSSKRFIVDASLYDEFIANLKQAFSTVKMGNPLDADTTLAPMSSQRAKDKLQKQVDEAIAGGATLVYGNTPVEDQYGAFFTPTILTDISKGNPVYDQELFGPVAQVYKVNNEDEAIALANDSQFGLGSVVFSSDIDHAKRVAAKIEAGMTFINTPWTTWPEIPFGGVKNSGYGRELSELGLAAFMNQHLVTLPS